MAKVKVILTCLITYKRFSQRYQVNMTIYKGVIVNKSSSSYRFNVCSLNVSDGNYLKTVKDIQNLRPRYRKPSRRGFQIISYMFNLNVKLPLANQICCTHYMCIITWNDRKCQNASKFLLRNGTESNNTCSNILLYHSNTFGLSRRIFLSRTSLLEPILCKERGGMNFQLCPLLGPPGILTGPNWHMHNLAMGPTI